MQPAVTSFSIPKSFYSIMAIQGQRFVLDPDAENFTFNLEENETGSQPNDGLNLIKEVTERKFDGIPPPPPKPKQSATGFPYHRPRKNASIFKKQEDSKRNALNATVQFATQAEPSDRAIANHINKKYGYDPESKERADISEENKSRIAQMSAEDIQEARAQLMSNLSPALIERLLRRANIDEDSKHQNWGPSELSETGSQIKTPSMSGFESQTLDLPLTETKKPSRNSEVSPEPLIDSAQDNDTFEVQSQNISSPVHFPVPPRNRADYVPLDPNSPDFLSDLKKHYFPSTSHDPSTLSWLQDPTEEESSSSPYAPTQTRYAPSDIRFDFNGRLIAPHDSREIPTDRGLHHHGDAPESAGYTIPELSILCRSALPNQRCIAYRTLGRILYRLGRGDFGIRGSELQEGLWGCVEKERPIEVMMSEANKMNGHVSANAYATEALWLWRKGGGGERGVLRQGETLAK